MILTGKNSAMLALYCQGRTEQVWNYTDRGEQSIFGMIVTGENRAILE